MLMPSPLKYARYLPRPPHTFVRALDELDDVVRQHEAIERRQFELELALEAEIERTWSQEDIQSAKMRAWYGPSQAPVRASKTSSKKTSKKTSKRKRKPRCEACSATDISPADEPGTDPELDYTCNRCGRIGSWEGAT